MTAASAESRYASGASWNLVPICTPARALAASAKSPYTPTSTRPGPVLMASRTAAPELVDPQDQHGYHDRPHGDDQRAPPGRLQPCQHHGQRWDEKQRDQVPDEGHVLVRVCPAREVHDGGHDLGGHQCLQDPERDPV